MNNFTSAQRKAVQLPDRFRCDQCQKWKHHACFSKKQLNAFTYKKASGQSVNGISARLRCILCIGGQNMELKCQGPCSVVQSLDAFSKQARSNGGSNWCLACTAWKEAAEPGITTAPAVSTDVAPDEVDTYATTMTNEDDTGALSDPEAGQGSDDDDYSYNNGYPGIAASDLDTVSSAGVRTNSVAVPYHGLGALSLSGASESQTENFRTASTFGTPLSGAGVAANTPTYTAFDPAGHPHVKQRIPSDTASQASTVVPPKNSNWAKPAGRRNEPKMTTPVVPPPARRRGYDSDSEDEM